MGSHDSTLLVPFSRLLSTSPPNTQAGIPAQAFLSQCASQQRQGSERQPCSACLPQGSHTGLAGAPLRCLCLRCCAGAGGTVYLPVLCSGCSQRRRRQLCLLGSLLGCPHLTTGKQQGFWGSNPPQTDFPSITAQGHPGAWGCPIPALAAVPVRPKP